MTASRNKNRDDIQKKIKGESIVNKIPYVEKRGIIWIIMAEKSPTFSSYIFFPRLYMRILLNAEKRTAMNLMPKTVSPNKEVLRWIRYAIIGPFE